MNERQEQTADVLGKLTVLGTIVLPMNIITGMWGMNVLVPGQEVDNLYWFWSSEFTSLPRRRGFNFQKEDRVLTASSQRGIVDICGFMLLHRKAGVRNRLNGARCLVRKRSSAWGGSIMAWRCGANWIVLTI